MKTLDKCVCTRRRKTIMQAATVSALFERGLAKNRQSLMKIERHERYDQRTEVRFVVGGEQGCQTVEKYRRNEDDVTVKVYVNLCLSSETTL